MIQILKAIGMRNTYSSHKRKYSRIIFISIFIKCVFTSIFAQINVNATDFLNKQTVTTKNGFVIVPPHPAYTVSLIPSTKFSVTVDGLSVPVRNASQASDALFFFCGETEIKVNFHEPINSFEISPKSLPASISTAGNTITIQLKSPRKFVIYNVNGDAESLSVFADSPPENVPDTTSVNVVNVRKYISIDKLQSISNATTHEQLIALNVSSEIQQAIIELKKGDVLFFPAGLYPTSLMKLKSDMELYLFPGSIIYSIRGTRKLNGTDTPLISMPTVSNTSIRGHGTIMSNGHIYNNGGDNGVERQIPMIMNGTNLVFTDFMIRDQQHWPWLLSISQNVLIRNVKILTSLDGMNRDGFGISTVKNILIEDNFVRSGDDALVIKARQTGLPFDYKLIARNNVFWNMYSGGGIKIGTQYWYPGVHNIAFENNDIISAPRSISFYFNDDTHNVEDVIFKNTRCENTFARPGTGTYMMDLKKGSVKNVRFVNLYAMHNSPFDFTTTKEIDVLFDGFYRYPNGKNQPPVPVLETVPVMPQNGVRFANNVCTEVGILSLLPAVSKPGIYEAFKIYRTGNLSSLLTIPYSVRTTAIPGTDFLTLSGSATFQVGQAEATISVELFDNAFKGKNKSILIVPDYIPNDYVMMNPDFQAFIAIISETTTSVISNPFLPIKNCKVFPNPTNGEFVLEVDEVEKKGHKAYITNIVGQIVYEEKILNNSTVFDISNQPDGIYLLKFMDKSGREILEKIQKH